MNISRARYTAAMQKPPKRRPQSPKPTDLETVGQRLARFRKARGLTQVEVARLAGTAQNLLSDYEHDNLRLYADLIVKFAGILEVSADEILGLSRPGKNIGNAMPLNILQRFRKIVKLPRQQQKYMLKTIDFLVRGVERGKRKSLHP